MNDPLERLRGDARRTAGVGHERPDLAGSLARIHERTAGLEPGGLTRQKRRRTGAWSVAGVGAVAAAGLVVSGAFTPDGGASPEAAPLTTAPTTPHASTPSATPQGGVTGEAVVYVKGARTAVAHLDLKDLIVSIESSDGVKHPDEKKVDTAVTREVIAGDGSASRWTDVKEYDAAVGTDPTGDQEVKKAVPGAKDGRMTYWWVSPRKGVYTEFPASAGGGDPSVPEQLADEVSTLGKTLRTVEQMAALDGVTSSAATTTTVDGKAAVCVGLKGGAATSAGWGAAKTGGSAKEAVAEYRKAVKAMGKHVKTDVVDWTSRTCFDPDTRLPVLHTYATHYQLPQLKSPSHSVTTTRYAWLPRNATTEKLVAPDLAGLRKLGYHEYVQLTK